MLQAFQEIFTLYTLFFIAFGVFLGYIVGAIPGMGKVTAVAVAIPITFYMNPVTAIGFLIGISKGSTSGNAVSAILINTPGEPSSVPTALDGYPLAQMGKATKALKVALYSSTIGDFVSTLILIMLTIPLSRVATEIGRVELAAILTFSLTFIAALSGKSLAKGLISGAFGLLLATIGLEVETGMPRLAFGYLKLYSGLPLIPITIGIVAVAEMIVQLEESWRKEAIGEDVTVIEKDEDKGVNASEWRRIIRPIFSGTLIGSMIGILPGLGASIASFASYGLTKRASKTPEKFGTGMIEGVAAAESADNAIIPSSLIPLFALGIPGSAIAAILSGGFIIHGIIPGPLMFRDNPDFVFGIYASMLIASLMMLVIGSVGLGLFAKVIAVPTKYLVPGVIFFSVLGAWLDTGSIFGVWVLIAFTIIGYFFKRFDFSFVTFLIGFIIGPEFELALRQTIIITRGESWTSYPIAVLFVVLTIGVVIRMIWTGARQGDDKMTR